MFYEKIDLYGYFSLPKPENGVGLLTVYCRERTGDLAPKKRPAMLVLPGGGYQYCSDREQEPVALRFLAAGYCAFVLKYAVKTPYALPLIEAAMAMAYIRENAEKYGIDGAHVAAVGFSAGGHLAGMLATLYGDGHIKETLKERANLVRPDAVLLSYPVLTSDMPTHGETMETISGGDGALRERLSIEKRVTSSTPPVFLWHTMEDDCVPVEGTLLMATALRAAKVPFELHVFEKGWHGTSVANIETEARTEALPLVEHLSIWHDLALKWLEKRGFSVKNFE